MEKQREEIKEVVSSLGKVIALMLLGLFLFVFSFAISGDDEFADRNPYKGTEYEEEWEMNPNF